MPRIERKRRPTMNDVARLAGVSQTTVSFVINNVADAGITDETKQRVWEAIRKLDYRPNAVAQGLRTSQSHIIGFLTDMVASSPHAGKIIEGAQDAAWAKGKILMIVNTGNNRAIAQAGVEMMLERQVEGIIYAAEYHQVVHPPKNIHEVPVVLLDCFVADRSLPSVVPDELGAGRAAAEILLSKGHRRIGLINVNHPDILPAARGRLDGYQQALAAYGVAFDPTIVRNGDGTAPSGYLRTFEIMQASNPPTALFCCTDRIAMGAYDALRELGLKVPHDVAVMGFDNEPLIASYVRPPLSTMELPHYGMGQWAVNYMVEHAGQTDDSNPIQHQLPCPYIERASI
jgi:LacI family transcriptional regulator